MFFWVFYRSCPAVIVRKRFGEFSDYPQHCVFHLRWSVRCRWVTETGRSLWAVVPGYDAASFALCASEQGLRRIARIYGLVCSAILFCGCWLGILAKGTRTPCAVWSRYDIAFRAATVCSGYLCRVFIGKSRKIHSRAGRCDDTGFGSRRRYVRSPHFRHLLIILIYDECFMWEFLSKYLYFSLKNI